MHARLLVFGTVRVQCGRPSTRVTGVTVRPPDGGSIVPASGISCAASQCRGTRRHFLDFTDSNTDYCFVAFTVNCRSAKVVA